MHIALHRVLLLPAAAMAESGEIIEVGGVILKDGDYLAVDADAPTDTKPAGGYAHYANGVLTLNNYRFTGDSGSYAFGALCDLQIRLVGDSRFDTDRGIRVDNGDLTIGGDGSVTNDAINGIEVNNGNVTISGGKVDIVDGAIGIRAEKGNVIISRGDVNITAMRGIDARVVMLQYRAEMLLQNAALILPGYRTAR